MSRPRTFFVAPFLLLTACGPKELAPPPAKMSLTKAADWAKDADPKLAKLRTVSGHLEEGDSAIDYSAWFSGPELRALQEVVDQGGYGRSTARYYFSADRIVYCKESSLHTRSEMDGKPGQDRIEKAFTFDENGNLTEFRKYLNGQPVTVEQKEVKEIVERGLKRRGEILKTAVR